MKKAIILLVASFFVLNGEIFAQKYGHINSNEVVQTMPEFKQMTAAVDKKKKDAQLILLSANIPNAKYYKDKFGFKIIQQFAGTSHVMSLSLKP